MPPRTLTRTFIIQKKLKTLNIKEDAEALAQALRSKGPVGNALRTLVRRVKNPHAPYNREDLASLLLLSIAEQRNEERA